MGRWRSFRPAVPPVLAFAVAPGLLLSGCELEEVSLTEPEDVLVAEVFVTVGDGPDEVTAYLQWTQGEGGPGDLRETEIRLAVDGGPPIELAPSGATSCLEPELALELDGTCFQAPLLGEDELGPGDRLEVEMTTADGRVLRGGMVLPGDFDFLQPLAQEVCALPSGVPLEVLWSRSKGAWAYSGEALIWGLREALGVQGVEVEQDSVSLLGLSISEADTSLVFPQEFGVFERFDLDRELALALQEGLPEGAEAQVVVAALERNFVNWVRGGNFNPSGAVRVPSLRGDGTGVLGGVVRRIVHVIGGPATAEVSSCLLGP